MALKSLSMTDDTLEGQVQTLYEHLEATESLPVDRTASRWIGEAQAVTGDLLGGAEQAVIRSRIGHVVSLLENVEGTDNEAADEHVEAALEIGRDIIAQ